MNGTNANKIVLDTNAIIYLQRGTVAEILPPGAYWISVITEIELLSFPGLSTEQKTWLLRLISDLEIADIDMKIKQCAIELRLAYRLKLPDALIAATALVHDALLLSNDTGFAKIASLRTRTLKLL